MKKYKKPIIYMILGLLTVYFISSGLSLWNDPLKKYIVKLVLDLQMGRTIIWKSIKFNNMLIVKIPPGAIIKKNNSELRFNFSSNILSTMEIKKCENWNYSHPAIHKKWKVNGKMFDYIQPQVTKLRDIEVHYFYNKELNILISIIVVGNEIVRNKEREKFFSILNHIKWLK